MPSHAVQSCPMLYSRRVKYWVLKYTTMAYQPPPAYTRSSFGPPAPPYGGGPPPYGGQGGYGAGASYSGPSHSANHGADDKLSKVVKDPLVGLVKWIKTRSPKEKLLMGCLAGVVVSPGWANRFHPFHPAPLAAAARDCTLIDTRWIVVGQVLLILWRTIEDHDTLFVLAEAAHFVGIGLLGWKMYSKKSVAGALHPALCSRSSAAAVMCWR